MLALWLLACSGSPTEPAPVDDRRHRVLVIGADGVRPDALREASTPALDRLGEEGLAVDDAQTQQAVPPLSGPGWTSLLTGQSPDVHGVIDNDTLIGRSAETPTFVQRAHEAGLQTAVVAHWIGIPVIVGLTNTGSLFTGLDAEVGAEALRRVEEDDDDLLFLHFDDPDHAGHASGFSPENPAYVEAIAGVDVHVAPLLEAVWARTDEAWRILFITDHGGDETGHSAMVPEVRTVPMKFWGEALPEHARTWRHEDVHDVVMAWLMETW